MKITISEFLSELRLGKCEGYKYTVYPYKYVLKEELTMEEVLKLDDEGTQ